LGVLVAGLATFGCGTYATLEISAPPGAISGSAFSITVTAMVGENRDTIINSPIKFTSSDPAAVLPPLYYFNANDAGSHTFTNGVTLMTVGNQSITATVIGAAGLTGSAKVTVSATAAQSKVSESASPPLSRRVADGRCERNVVTSYIKTIHFTCRDEPFAWRWLN
jgi:hypothetical protein